MNVFKYRASVGTIVFIQKTNNISYYKNVSTSRTISLQLKYSFILSKITPVVCPGTHTKPLILIGSVPTKTMVPRFGGVRFHTPRLVGGVPGTEHGC